MEHGEMFSRSITALAILHFMTDNAADCSAANDPDRITTSQHGTADGTSHSTNGGASTKRCKRKCDDYG
jgi:hypothetical protein